MSWTAITLGTMGFVAFNYFMFTLIERPELKLLKVWHFFMFYISGISLGLLPYIISNNAADETSFSLVSTVYVLIVIFGTLIFVYSYIIKIILQSFRDVDDKAKAISKERDRRIV